MALHLQYKTRRSAREAGPCHRRNKSAQAITTQLSQQAPQEGERRADDYAEGQWHCRGPERPFRALRFLVYGINRRRAGIVAEAEQHHRQRRECRPSASLQ